MQIHLAKVVIFLVDARVIFHVVSNISNISRYLSVYPVVSTL